ncbi:MAG TPA: TetR/AcrR family transcriptional regulator [Burkholderiaceae bacterium]|nr:TetR/AcrR family transcriptional regulator [Burkholderiaceae bacterium]
MKNTETTACAAPALSKPRGRPLSFDRDTALEKAMHVFWQHGYEAASVSELTAAMGITPPSLYAAFGDKERLFLEAIERYGKGPGSYVQRALDEAPSARGAIERLLREAAAELTQACHPLGCMMVMATTNCSVAAEHIQDALVKRRALGVAMMQARIQRGVDEGELPGDTDAGALANFYSTVYQGMSMQAKDGASRASLLRSVEMAMRSWPAAPPAPPRAAKKPAVKKRVAKKQAA